MAAKIKKGDKVVVSPARTRASTGEVLEGDPDREPRAGAGVNIVKRHRSRRQAIPGRHHFQGSADPRVERRARRSQGRQADPRRLQVRMDGKKVRVAKRSGETIDG
jgi:large subunit ribosomal protein L24